MNGALALTFDVDAESVWLATSPTYSSRLSTLSEARYGIGRGLRRVLNVLAANEAHGTFYVPGATAEAHPAAVEMILEGGHTLGHHGHEHLKSHEVDPDTEREEIKKAYLPSRDLESGPRDIDLHPGTHATTLDLLPQYGFRWDSSLMEDDRPYTLAVGDARLIELPVHWSLDDWPHFGVDR